MLGLMYDVHGNLPALEAVLADAKDVDRWLLGGDYTLFGAWPVETTERLRELEATWIRGNGERWTASPSDAPEAVQGAIAWCAEQLSDGFVSLMGALPETWRHEDTLYCHGSPRSDVESLCPSPRPTRPNCSPTCLRRSGRWCAATPTWRSRASLRVG